MHRDGFTFLTVPHFDNKPFLPLPTAHLTYPGQNIPLRVTASRGRSLRLSITPEAVHLQTPTGKLGPQEETFLREKAAWAARAFARVQQRGGSQAELRAALPAEVQLFGRRIPVVYAPGEKLYFRYADGVLGIRLPVRHFTNQALRPKAALAVLKQLARRYLTQRTTELATQTGMRVTQVRIKNHRSKWGSCSTLGNINLNWQLVLLSKEVIDYVIIHELMHLKEMNHGPRFWALVGKHLPDYKARLANLRAMEWVIGVYESV